MPFDPSIFEAEVALKLIPTEQLPTKAQQALEAGFDGPRTVRMAILDSKSYWEIEQVLPEMLNELGMTSLSPKEAAMRLATLHAKHLLETREDPISSLSRFHRLMQAGDYPDELQELGWLGDELDGCTGCYTADEQSEFAIEALENLLSPELRERRRAEREAKWLKQREEAKCDWPYIFDSPTRRALLKEPNRDRLVEMRPLFWIEAAAWLLLGWAFGSWKTVAVGYLVTKPLLMALSYWSEYRRLKRERRDLLLRLRVPEDQI